MLTEVQQMALYESRPLAFNTPVVLKEQPIYGAARIGIIHAEKVVYTSGTLPAESSQNTLGAKNYELTNYLGNVNAVITDRKTSTLKAPTITDQVGISVSGGVITQTEAAIGWGSAAGASVEQIHQGGYVEWTLGGTTPEDNRLIMVGLSYTNVNAHYNNINNIWHTHDNGVAYIYEKTTARGSFGTYAPGDVFRIERKCDSIVYYFKGIRRRAVADPQPLAPMIVDFAMNAVGKSIYKLEIQSGAAYEAVAIMKADYYPFGMQMPGRSENSTAYRYGYNGMEKDDEVKGDGNSYSTEFRQYDPRLGRWLSLDPLMHQFPWMSPYVAFDNNPIYYIDPYGLEGKPVNGDTQKKYKDPEKSAKRWISKNERQGNIVKNSAEINKHKDGSISVQYQRTSDLKNEDGVQARSKYFKQEIVKTVSVNINMLKMYEKYNSNFRINDHGKYIQAKYQNSILITLDEWDKISKPYRNALDRRNAYEQSLPLGHRPSAQGYMEAHDDVWWFLIGAKGGGTKLTVNKGKNIVGTTFNEILPTQDWINPAAVAKYKELLLKSKKIAPIEAYTQGGKVFIEDGHHRFVAYMELGMKPNMIIRNTGGPVGFPNWLNTIVETQK